MKDLMEKYELEAKEIITSRENLKKEYDNLIVTKEAELEQISRDIDNALSEDNLQKVEELTIRKTGLEMFVKLLKEKKGTGISEKAQKEFELQGSTFYHNMVSELSAAEEKELAKAYDYIFKAMEIVEPLAKMYARGQSALYLWTTNISTIDGAASVSIKGKSTDVYNHIKRLIEQ